MTIEDKYSLIINKLGLKEYYYKDYYGQNVKIASIESLKSDHGSKVCQTLKTYAPQCEVISFNDEMGISATGDLGTIDTINFPKFANWCIENKVDIVTSSLNWSCDKEVEKEAIKKLYDKGIIFFNCVPNDDDKECKLDENGDMTYNIDKGIVSVGGVQLAFKSNGTSKETYNFAYGEAVDVIGYNDNVPYINENNKWSSWSGNSASTPLIASMFAVLKSAGFKVNSKNVFDIIRIYGTDFIDGNNSYKKFTMPNLEIVEDEPIEEWKKEYEESFEKAIELGITDGTRSDEEITRKEVSVMIYRLYKLLKEE